MGSPKKTPMLEQYFSIKSQYPDAIMFYRMGDFYEMFFEDAKAASRVLEIALTSRNKKDKNPIPMCGVPHRAVNTYISKLIEHGYKVAVCDQVEDASQAKGLVKRDVIRVVTPGMILDQKFLDARSNNFVLAISPYKDVIGLACLDISTGTFRLTESKSINSILDEARRISPSELVFPESNSKDVSFSILLKAFSEKTITYFDSEIFDPKRSKQRLLKQLKTRSFEGFGCENKTAGLSAAGALLHYVHETQKQEIPHLVKIESYRLDNFLLIDEVSARNLELVRNLRTGAKKGSLLGLLDQTKTALGGRLLRRWIRYPLLDINEIAKRLDAVEDAKNNLSIRKSVRECLSYIYDLKRLASKIALKQCTAQDLISLKTSVQRLPELWSYLSDFNADLLKKKPPLDQLLEMADLIEKAIREDAPPVIKEGGIIKIGYNKELDELIHISQDGKSWLAKLEADERKATGISTLKVRFNKVFGYYIEVSKAQSKLVPDNYIRKQTLVNAERYITDELKSFESKVLTAEERRAGMEYEIFCSMREEILKYNKHIQKAAAFTAQIDCIFTLSEIADLNGYTRPKVHDKAYIFIEDGRHPVVEKIMTAERFVPNTINMDNTDNQILIITGPNMAGKSTILRQVALLTLMAQIGSFIPARSASISIVDKIFTRVGASDNLSQGQSTFMVEMEEAANILNNATERSLIIMDEIGRGTSTFDGLSIAWAVAEYLHDWNNIGVKTLFATHYHELTALDQFRPRVKNYNIAVKEINDEIIFLRHLKKGGASRSYGIQVARLAGIPDSVLKRAKTILSNIEKGKGIYQDIKPKINKPNLSRVKSTKYLKHPKIKNKQVMESVQLGLF
ncbi:DNA mismatch repair protein MutS [Candidatus Magnetomoraceae bacterium gMMP-13]